LQDKKNKSWSEQLLHELPQYVAPERTKEEESIFDHDFNKTSSSPSDPLTLTHQSSFSQAFSKNI
jgi:hypothetical protein